VARLNSLGSSRLLRRALFPIGFSGEVTLHIVKTWQTLSLNSRVTHETNITAVFRDALIAAYVASGRSWFITLEDPITDTTFGTELGRNDLRFYPPNHHGQTLFFTVECKRLRVTTKAGISSLAEQYVVAGIQRFIDGQYSAGLPCGGMVGYVMDNDMDEAFAAVQTAITSKQTEVRLLQDGLRIPSRVVPNYQWSADTRHKRMDGDFAVHHALLGIAREMQTQAATREDGDSCDDQPTTRLNNGKTPHVHHQHRAKRGPRCNRKIES
jgi:acyl dehydratase